MNSVDPLQVIAVVGSGVAAFGACLLLPHYFITDVIISVPVTTMVMTGVSLLRSKPTLTTRVALDTVLAPNADEQAALAAIEKGVSKLKAIRDAAMEIHAPNVRRRITAITNVGDEIIDNIRRDHDNVRAANLWLNNYLDMFQEVVRRYANASRQGFASVQAQEAMSKMDETLDQIEQSFNDQLQKLVSNDAMDLDVDLQVLRTMLKQEGV
jgi:5-bromo-4-chloroindolyl phosphate hydrolysis protein